MCTAGTPAPGHHREGGERCVCPRALVLAPTRELAQQIDLEAIRQLRPFPEWLQGERRSNHAGETGAVNIYIGCQSALALRKWLLPSHLLRHDTELSEFAAEHENSERTHLVMLNQVPHHPQLPATDC